MIFPISISDSQAAFSKGECIYQCVLDDFRNSSFVGIMTYNISSKPNSNLLEALKNSCKNGTNAVIITNIPKRFSSHFGPQYAIAAKDKIKFYMQQLKPEDYGMRLSPYFTFHNHAKIVMTDNIVYWGSSNFSDESIGNFECGTVSTDRNLITYLKETLFPDVQKKSIPYFKHNFAVAIANLDGLIPACRAARQRLFDAAYEPQSGYKTGSEESWLYRTTDSGITVHLLRGFISFFSKFDDALDVIYEIIDAYVEYDELPHDVELLQSLLGEYKQKFDSFYNSISALFNDLEQVAQYDVSVEACYRIEREYGMEAYDEYLDYFAEKAMNEASEEYTRLIEDSEYTVIDALDSLDSMIQYFEQLKIALKGLLEINPKIDNTGIK